MSRNTAATSPAPPPACGAWARKQAHEARGARLFAAPGIHGTGKRAPDARRLSAPETDRDGAQLPAAGHVSRRAARPQGRARHVEGLRFVLEWREAAAL